MQVALLRTSFDLIEPHKEAFAEAFYNRLFRKYPQTRAFFAHTDMHEQARAFAAMLAVVISGVEKGEDLTPALHHLGARHKTYGVWPEHFPLVGEVLIETLRETLGTRWTPAHREAWLQAYEQIAHAMSAPLA